jgi:ATP-dependent Lon protease
MSRKKSKEVKHVESSEMTDNEADTLIPIIPTEEDNGEFDELNEMDLPMLPVRNTVLFPNVVIPVTVGRQKSIKLVQKVYKGDRLIGVLSQKNVKIDDPTQDDLFEVGTLAKIIKLLTLPDGSITIIIQGKKKFRVREFVDSQGGHLSAKIEFLHERKKLGTEKEQKAMIQALKDAALKIVRLNPDIPREAEVALDNIESPIFLMHFLASNINAEVGEKQGLLEIANAKERAAKLLQYLLREIQLLEIKQEIHNKAHSDLDQQQRDYFLRQQMKVLQDELGDGAEKEVETLKIKGEAKKWSDSAKQHFLKELGKIQRVPPASPEYGIALNYCEFMVDLPWESYTEDNFDLENAQNVLDGDHYGLEKVKERIIEYLAVLKLKNDMRGPILCLYGPPGVGKTSLGRSIATSLGRKYIRMSLGGLHDEAEIRGHRKTYIGAMPGKVLQNLKRAGASNPVFILDEIDKIGSDFRGDPASALLEVLDPEQNSTFVDNYLEVEYDLSKVLFIATANTLDTIHPALRDRMEIIEITGYTLEEKLEISKKHLIHKQAKEHGLKEDEVSISDEALQFLIESYTRESGVRSLERKIGALMRRVAKHVAMNKEHTKVLEAKEVEEILGVPVFDKELYQDNETAGLVTGLAWTSVGGEVLFVESSLNRGKGKLTLSGQLGDVMKESAIAALSYLRANADSLGIDYRIFDQYDLHIHLPAGATPKDGPSAGITMFTSMASIYTQRKVKDKLAMTGEITLRGKVLPVGGIKEKILAAKRAGITDIIMSDKNQKDISEIQEHYLKGLTFHYVKTVEEVLKLALLEEKVKNPINFVIEEDKK